MTLPSNVPHFSTYVVDFDHLEPAYVERLPGSLSRVWEKLAELERRLNAFDWATMVVREPRQCTTFIADLAFAYVLGFEATLQVMKHEDRSKSESWLQSLSEYDMPCRGIRTLRNLEAHVRSGQMQPGSGRGVYTRFSTGMTPQPAVAWRLPAISLAEYSALAKHGRKLASSELADWNQYVGAEYAANIMRASLISLVEIVKQA